MIRVEVQPQMLRWARDRAGLSGEALARRFPKLEAWELGEAQPTLKQLESFAKATYTPIGFFFLKEPPVETVPIPDFRTAENAHVGHPSPNLLDTIYVCEQRQEWYRDFARSMGEEPLGFVGSVQRDADVESVAGAIRDALGLDLEERRRLPTWTDALRRFIEQADESGILVMVSGVVLNNNRRRLDPAEFRGFAMSDSLAPLVFINGADTKAAQMFTLAHELAHVWLGQSALSDAQARWAPDGKIERWCNRVAAELLVPLAEVRGEYRPDAKLRAEVDRLARRFKVSTLVVLRRIHDAGGLTREELWHAYDEELKRLRELPRGSGGNFYLTQAARVSKRFARALVASTLEGQTLHTDAFRMLGFSRLSTFQELGRNLGGHCLMAYLLDANAFIQGKDLHYGFDFCPAFWDWLLEQNASGHVFSIERVGDEIEARTDELSVWAAARGAGFFLKPDAAILDALQRVSAWIASQRYEPSAVNTFLSVADYYLVGHALAHGYAVVTHEKASTSTKKVKIPEPCIGLGVKCMTPFEMLRKERARFVLGRAEGR